MTLSRRRRTPWPTRRARSGLDRIVGSEHFKGLKSGKLAGLVRLGLRVPAAADITFDGILDVPTSADQASLTGASTRGGRGLAACR